MAYCFGQRCRLHDTQHFSDGERAAPMPRDDAQAADERTAASIRPHQMESRKPIPPPIPEAIIPFTADDLPRNIAPTHPTQSEVLKYQFGPPAAPIRRILVLKL